MGNVCTYAKTPGSVESTVFEISAGQDKIFVEKFRSIHYARFIHTEGTRVCMRITVSETVKSCVISPERLGIVPQIERNEVSFILPENARHLLVQTNGLEDLIILADPPEAGRPKPSDPNVLDIMALGIDNTGKAVETDKIQQAIDSVIASPGRDTLYFPNGCYRTGSLRIGGGMRIYLEEGALIKGSLDFGDYPVFDRYPKRKLLLVHDADGFELSGRGVIDGEGAALNDKYQTDASKLIDLVETINCRNVVIRDVVLRNSSNWACLLSSTEDAVVGNAKVLNVPHHLWMDAFDVSVGRNVLFENCFAYSHDDCWAIMTLNRYGVLERGETSNITIRNYTGWTLCSGTRIGWDSNERIDGVLFENVDFVFAEMQHVAIHRLKEEKLYGTVVLKNCGFERCRQSDQFLHCEGPSHEPEDSVEMEKLCFIDCSIDESAKNRTLIRGGARHGIGEVVFDHVLAGGKAVTSVSDLSDIGIDFANVSKVSVTSERRDVE
jgi:hypothetical protein